MKTLANIAIKGDKMRGAEDQLLLLQHDAILSSFI
jgi:hypothetical protein